MMKTIPRIIHKLYNSAKISYTFCNQLEKASDKIDTLKTYL